jgi:hypothetical protein
LTRLVWGAPGAKVYETGVDRGVFYLYEAGVVWDGLVSVSEKISGGEATPHWVDGIKYAETFSPESFDGSIEVYSYPPEFNVCIGSSEIIPGFVVAQQPKQSFGMTYRTLLGNDTSGNEFGYKIHLVYNMLAGSSEQSRNSITDTAEPSSLSIPFTTTPVLVADKRASAHFVIDSRATNPFNLALLEDILYGSEAAEARLPSVSEIVSILVQPTVFDIVDNGDGTWTATGPDEWINAIDSTTFDLLDTTVVVVNSTTYTISSA